MEFPGDQRNAVDFDETMQDVLYEEYMAARIIGALSESDRPLNSPEVAKTLGLRPQEVSPILQAMAQEDRLTSRFEKGYMVFGLAKAGKC